ncbi:hypothetical protein ACHAXR_002598, partial [Thalassiosira sp. AJA248-18]
GLFRRDPTAVVDALKESGVEVVKQIDAVSEAAMYKAGGVKSRTHRRQMRQHLRFHFGKNVVVSERELMKLSKGHSGVEIGHYMHDKNDGEKPERIEYSTKNMAREVEVQTACMMEANELLPDDIERIDLVTGGDHGKEALQQGLHVTITTMDGVDREGHDEDDPHSFTYELIVAEAICKKDNAKIMENTINKGLTPAMKEIVESKLAVEVGEGGNITCRFLPLASETTLKTFKVELYVVSDLAFYGMALGREGMMGAWCYLCRLSHAEFQDLLREGDDWVMAALQAMAKEVAHPSFKEQSKNGVKVAPWWWFIPLRNFLPPILHLLIGIWNDIWDKFREFISEHIEYISKDEADLREKKASLLIKIEDLKKARDNWKVSEDGKKLASAKSKFYRLKRALTNLRTLNNITGMNTPSSASAISDLLTEMDQIIEEEDNVEEGSADDYDEGQDNQEDGAPTEVESENEEVQAKINELKVNLKSVQNEINELEKIFNKFSGTISKANKMLKKIRENISTYKSDRKKSGDGIESEMFDWMKLFFRIQQPAYHGGKLIGKDSVKMMANAYEMFTHFATVLKDNKKDDTYSDAMIDEICNDYARLSILWDGAFSLASKHNPTTDDISNYKRYVRAAIFTHQAMKMSITHKGHLMWRHVAAAMRVPGGLGKKRED